MTAPGSLYVTTQIEPEDAAAGFSCEKHPLDDYFKRHALANDRSGVSRAYVLRRADGEPAELPAVLGYYTLSMALVEAAAIARCCRPSCPGTRCPSR